MKLIFENFKKCEEYISLMHLCYELIFPYSNDGKSYVYILQITDKNYMYQLFNIYSYLLRYSYILKKLDIFILTNNLLSFIYRFSGAFSSITFWHKRILVQLAGLMIGFTSYKRKRFNRKTKINFFIFRNNHRL